MTTATLEHRPLLARVSARRYAVDIALAALVIVVLGPIVASNSAQPASRLDLTAAVAEHGSVDITRYPVGVDYSVVHGRKRSDKPPGQALLAVPLYAAARVAGAQSAEHLRQKGSLTLWWVTFWSATVPFALLLVMMRRVAARIAPRAALPATLCLGFGALMLPYSVNLFGHVLAAAFAFGAWYVLDREAVTPARAAAAGLLAGLAIFVEYEAAIVAAVLLIVVITRHRSSVGAFIGAAALPVAALALYFWIAFGAPWRLSYAAYRGRLAGTSNLGLRLPFRPAAEILFSTSRGFLLVSPLLLLAIGASIWVARHGDRSARPHGWIALTVFGGYLLVVSSFADASPSDYPGARYLIVAVPFLAAPLAAAWTDVRVAAIGCALWGGVLMAAATFTGLLVGTGEPLLSAYTTRLRARVFEPTVWSIGFGRVGVVLYLSVVIAVTTVSARVFRLPSEEGRAA